MPIFYMQRNETAEMTNEIVFPVEVWQNGDCIGTINTRIISDIPFAEFSAREHERLGEFVNQCYAEGQPLDTVESIDGFWMCDSDQYGETWSATVKNFEKEIQSGIEIFNMDEEQADKWRSAWTWVSADEIRDNENLAHNLSIELKRNALHDPQIVKFVENALKELI